MSFSLIKTLTMDNRFYLAHLAAQGHYPKLCHKIAPAGVSAFSDFKKCRGYNL
jgi:hypothetical protein